MKKTLAVTLAVLALNLFTACGGAASAAGSYDLDAEAFKTAMLAVATEKAPNEEAKKMMAEQMGKMFANVKGQMNLAEGGEYTVKIEGMPGQTIDEKGSWKLDGDKLTVTQKVGDKDESKVLQCKDGTITLEEEKDGVKVKMVFRRKAS